MLVCLYVRISSREHNASVTRFDTHTGRTGRVCIAGLGHRKLRGFRRPAAPPHPHHHRHRHRGVPRNGRRADPVFGKHCSLGQGGVHAQLRTVRSTIAGISAVCADLRGSRDVCRSQRSGEMATIYTYIHTYKYIHVIFIFLISA